MTVTEAAKELGVKSWTLYTWSQKGKIKIDIISPRVRLIDDEEVARLKSELLPKDFKKCKECNSAIGFFNEDIQILVEAVEYMKRNKDGSGVLNRD